MYVTFLGPASHRREVEGGSGTLKAKVISCSFEMSCYPRNRGLCLVLSIMPDEFSLLWVANPLFFFFPLLKGTVPHAIVNLKSLNGNTGKISRSIPQSMVQMWMALSMKRWKSLESLCSVFVVLWFDTIFICPACNRHLKAVCLFCFFFLFIFFTIFFIWLHRS